MLTLPRAWSDLVLGVACSGCGAAGVMLCHDCRGRIAIAPRVRWPDPTPTGLVSPRPVPPVASGTYEGVLRSVLIDFKEHRRQALLPILSRMLADAVRVAAPDRPVLLVPMPSRPAAVRARGHDGVRALASRTARDLRRRGVDVRVSALLRHRTDVVDQAGLDADQRRANLDGALAARPAACSVATERAVLVVDDVVTTGASAAAAVLALRRSGVEPVAVCAVCATPRRWSGR